MTALLCDGPLAAPTLPKCPTGIVGLDEITGGGLPRGRPTLVCGNAGCGKTLLGMEFLVRGARDLGEPGVLMAFEERREDLVQNVRSLGFDVETLIAQGKMHIDHVHLVRKQIEETGEYDLEGLFIRLGHAIDKIGARRVVIDTPEALFSCLSNTAILRSELRRLFDWLKERGMTAVITGESGEHTLTRTGLEEYVSDCVIALDHRVVNQVCTRRLRIVKYRGSLHGTNEYPFLIDEHGLSILPISSLALRHKVSEDRIPSGIARLDAMLDGKGFYRGSSVLISGTAGTGKTSIAATFADASCRRGERCLYLAYEEAEDQIVRDLRSIGLDLGPWAAQGLLRFHAVRPASTGLEMHLVGLHKLIQEFQPHAVVVDPISALVHAGTLEDAHAMMLRLIDYLKTRQITAVFTNLVTGGHIAEGTELAISSLIDTWILLRDIELGGERNRGLYVLKSRGMKHSNQIREFLLTDRGIELQDVYLGPEGVLTGSMRLAQEAREQADSLARRSEMERRARNYQSKRRALLAQITALQDELHREQEDLQALLTEASASEKTLRGERTRMARSRQSDVPSLQGEPPV